MSLRQMHFENLMERIKQLPQEPGCYLMKDHAGKIFYIGKAVNLRSRVRSYFGQGDSRPFVAWLSRILADIETIVVRNNTEALLLEQTLVRKHQPRHNVLLKDDKNFILLRLDTRKHPDDAPLHLRYPRLDVVRRAKNDGARYFGPYPSAGQLRMTVHIINKYFQLRTCNDHVIDNRGRPCIQHQIGRCPAPCVYDVPQYKDEMDNVVDFLTGHTNEVEKRLKRIMVQASENQHYELAARLRDQLAAVKTSLTKQAVTKVSVRRNQDAVAVNRSGPFLEIVRVIVKKGQILGTARYSFDHQEFPTEELVASFLTQVYANMGEDELPDEILTSIDIDQNALPIAEVKRPTRGRARALVEIAQKNVNLLMAERLQKMELRNAAVTQLQKLLGLTSPPKVIECFDVSLFQGTDAVASQVVFVDGAPDKSRYRKFNIKTVEGTDDFAMLYEVITRRIKRGLTENNLPDLLLVDGGKGQLSVALAACKDQGLKVTQDGFFVAAIAKARSAKKTDERLFIPGVKDPIPLAPHTKERYLVEQLRDEAHRFAITSHRSKRKRRTLQSELENIPGVGEKRRKILLKTLGSLKAVMAADVETLAKIPGIGRAVAEKIKKDKQNETAG